MVKNNFYVYCHQTKDDGRCFYIGKGKDDRAYSKSKRNPHWHNKVKKHGGFNAVILVNGISEEKAFELEVDFIKQIGRENLVNMTDGGEGNSGLKHSEETKSKISKASKGRKHTEEACKKISDNNFYKGKFGVNNPLSKSINQYSKDGTFIKTWGALREIERELKINRANISSCCEGKNSYKSAGGFIWRYVDDDSEVVYIKHANSKKVNQYTIEGDFVKSWDLMMDIERELKINHSSISAVCNNKKKSAGNFLWEYAD